MDGSFFAYFTALYDYYRYIGVRIDVDTSIIDDQINFGLIYPLDHYCVICERMSKIKTNRSGLHCDGGTALEYLDGTKIWSLNGVVVPQWLAEKRHDQIDCGEFSKIENAEVRREFVRKIGIERICKKLNAKTLDKKGDYELVEIDLLGETGKWPYLRMRNPSIDAWHMECVGRECRTVEHALNFRNQSELTPEVLT
jgi:hypothetical protein